MDFHALFGVVTIGFELLGVAALTAGFIVALLLSVKAWMQTRDWGAAFRILREGFGGVILLGLEILVAADLIKTVTNKSTITDVAMLGMIVLIRTILGFALQTEIDGVAPWRRALVTGPEVIWQTANRVDQPTEIVSEDPLDP